MDMINSYEYAAKDLIGHGSFALVYRALDKKVL